MGEMIRGRGDSCELRVVGYGLKRNVNFLGGIEGWDFVSPVALRLRSGQSPSTSLRTEPFDFAQESESDEIEQNEAL
jgi:hypothetical protein